MASSFDSKLRVWRNIPDESGADPDLEYFLPSFIAWGAWLYGNTLALAGVELQRRAGVE